MSRVVLDDCYYITSGGRIPVKWTAPEVRQAVLSLYHETACVVCPWRVRLSPPSPLQALLQRKYSASSDVWSYGIVMFEIWSAGCKPFEDKTAVEVS